MKLVLFDCKQGIKNQYYKYIIAAIIYIFICLLFSITYNLRNGLSEFSFVDVLMYFFRGKHIDQELSKNEFPAPIYMFFQILMAYIVGNYCYRDLKERARYVVVRTGNRSGWFISKVLWSIISVTAAYALMWGIICILCIIHPSGEISIVIHQKILSSICDLGNIVAGDSEVILNILLVPYITQICIAVIQVSLELIFNPLISYIAIMTVIILSAYYRMFFYIGNGFMIINNSCIEGGVVEGKLIMIFGIICAFVIMSISYIRFRKIDIL